MSYFNEGPSTVLDCILFMMMLCKTGVRKMTINEIFEEIVKQNWCDGTLTHDILTKVLSENDKMFLIINNVYTLNDYGISKAMKVYYE